MTKSVGRVVTHTFSLVNTNLRIRKMRNFHFYLETRFYILRFFTMSCLKTWAILHGDGVQLIARGAAAKRLAA